jgi:hypothetical protein
MYAHEHEHEHEIEHEIEPLVSRSEQGAALGAAR